VRRSLSGKLMLALASTVVLGSESRGTHGHILLSRDFRSSPTHVISEEQWLQLRYERERETGAL
jgi:hypothetical protein